MTDERDDTPATVTQNPWQALRRLTPARIALGRAGVSLPTRPQLAFQAAHAQARDAVHLPFDPAALQAQLHAQGNATLLLHSAVRDRDQYLQRPDLGRQLDAPSAQLLGTTRPRIRAVSISRWWSPTGSPRWRCIGMPRRSSPAWPRAYARRAGRWRLSRWSNRAAWR